MNISAVRTGECGISWCVTCIPSIDPDDHPHRHRDLALEVELSCERFDITVERSCQVYGDGTRLTTIDVVRNDRYGFGVDAEEARQLADLLRLPQLHYGQDALITLSETPDAPLIVFTDTFPTNDPRDYLLHIAQCGVTGQYFRLTPVEARLLGGILHDLSENMA
ncbi:hypothetical protein ACL02S_23290 [Nocardia sp. 004]|uniref:hypothetical protein n=1 Tax=Nocardia sp. 004 TaxID=3385978 RepID=UPI0039A12162